MEKANYKLVTTISLLFFLFLTCSISIGYSALNSSLNVSGDLNYYAPTSGVMYDRIESLAKAGDTQVREYTGNKSTFTGTKKIYYYRGDGNLAKNYVEFAGYCWRIVRTTDTGGVKILYDGRLGNHGSCGTGALMASQMGTSNDTVAFNNFSGALSSSGYMMNGTTTTTYNVKSRYDPDSGSDAFVYGTDVTYSSSMGYYTLQTPYFTVASKELLKDYHYACPNVSTTCPTVYYIFNYEEYNKTVYYIELRGGKKIEDAYDEMLNGTLVNTSNSTVKAAIDYWYKNNMTDYTKYLEDTVWCNDRSVINSDHGWNKNGGSVVNNLQFGSLRTPTDLTCPDIEDRFTVSSTIGNGKLTYPIALITKPEASLITTSTGSNASPIGYSSGYWTMSPSEFYSYGPGIYYVGSSNPVSVTTNLAQNVKPAISLKPGIKFTGGDGSMSNPYYISLST